MSSGFGRKMGCGMRGSSSMSDGLLTRLIGLLRSIASGQRTETYVFGHRFIARLTPESFEQPVVRFSAVAS